VTFEEQTAELSPESEAALKRLARDLMQRPGFNLEIQARVDSVGPEAFNYMLTQARAIAVRDFLVVEGVPAERLIARGFGSEPIPEANGQMIAFVVRR
jgi:outer membrane protein OmpA-like peptidoglycan-associated protein